MNSLSSLVVLVAFVALDQSFGASLNSNSIERGGRQYPAYPVYPAYPGSDYLDAYNEEILRVYWTLKYLQYLKSLRDQQQQGNNNLDNNNLGNRFGEESTTASRPGVEVLVPAPVTKPPQVTNQENCKQVGERCTYHSECCSNACLFYLAKCVSG